MKLISVIFFTCFSFLHITSNSEEVLSKMYNKYAGKWMTSFSFTQTTEQYRNDSLLKTSTWFEHIVYPDKFRIDFGDTTSGNAAIFTSDSVYSFHNGKLARRDVNDDDLTFILGGMYFYPFDTVKSKLIHAGYDLDKFCEAKLDNTGVYVIGANNTDEKSNQLWIDKEKLVVVKFINYNHGEKEEGIFKGHKQFGNSWSETACDFYINGKIIQREKYYDCKANENIAMKIFDYKNFVPSK